MDLNNDYFKIKQEKIELIGRLEILKGPGIYPIKPYFHISRIDDDSVIINKGQWIGIAVLFHKEQIVHEVNLSIKNISDNHKEPPLDSKTDLIELADWVDNLKFSIYPARGSGYVEIVTGNKSPIENPMKKISIILRELANFQSNIS